MKATMSADYTRIGIKNYIYESYEGSSKDCEKWVFSKMEEVFDFFNKDNFLIVTSYRQIMVTIKPESYIPIRVKFSYE